MGASIRKDFSSRATHLVAKSTGGEKYRVSSTYVSLCQMLVKDVFYLDWY
jgi:hypothetical protein